MNRLKVFLLIAIISNFLLLRCSSHKEDDDPSPSNPPGNPNPNPNQPGTVTITATSPEFTFWGDELTIKGTGFSSVKSENKIRFIQYYGLYEGMDLTSDGDIEVISATSEEIKIRIPYTTQTGPGGSEIHSGLDYTKIEIEVNEKKDTSDIVKFIGLPYIGTFEYHYGWYDVSNITRIGDSVLIGAGFRGMSGAATVHPTSAGLMDKLRLTVGGHPVPVKYRQISNAIHGYAFYLPPEEFSDMDCSQDPDGWAAREMTFEIALEGTDKKDSKSLLVQHWPDPLITKVEGPPVVYKDEGDIMLPWKVEGKNMYYTHPRFIPLYGCAGNPTVDGGSMGTDQTFSDEYSIYVPLSLLPHDCSYTIALVTPCDELKVIGSVAVELTR